MAPLVKRNAIVTGSAGFIGFYVSKKLLESGWKVWGIDCLSEYYDVSLKTHREKILLNFSNFKPLHRKIEEPDFLLSLFSEVEPDIVVHLAAQAGVRFSIENPRSYLESNICGTFELLEAARAFPPKHMVMASTSSAYGANFEMPYRETEKTDHQMSFYAATKKSTENISHSYSHLFDLPITMFRFFTVYGPWGRPDMALFKFTKSILEDKQIDVYNFGKMKRDFTFIEDLAHAIILLVDAVPRKPNGVEFNQVKGDSLSPVAPFRIVNIGNSKIVELKSFIEAIEEALGKKASKNMLPIQAGDVPATWANTDLLFSLTGYRPSTSIFSGVKSFVKWYKDYYGISK